ncbi:hypothetical protein L2E82_45900 [Cichorium intybus]|uniref:Uncharacterized protein n=1 Tax=Cichorium intybus TaxID=13427 RepID=A0ACB8ZV44_CICIN|nr:hypothetical protein L2E82_45900 [Cichorium intybus]
MLRPKRMQVFSQKKMKKETKMGLVSNKIKRVNTIALNLVSNKIKRFQAKARNLVSNNIIKRSEIKAGDHIYTYRAMNAYAHHGIYVGDNKVIHFTSHKGNKSSNRPKSEVIITSLDVFLRNGDLYRYEYGVTKDNFMDKIRGGCCTTATSDKADTVIHRANYLLRENGFGKYSLTKNNCEDFSLYCKTGLRIIGSTQMRSSGQVAAVVCCISSMSWLPMPLLVLSPSLWLLVSLKRRVSVSLSLSSVALLPKPILTLTVVSPELRKLNADIGSRYDVEKVCVAKLVDKMHLR